MQHLAQALEDAVRDLRIFGRQLSLSPLANVEAILGPRSTWDLEADSLSEHAYFVRLWREDILSFRTARDTGTLPALWDAVKHFDRLRSRFAPLPIGHVPCSVRYHAPERFQDESWFFINGVCTDKEILQLNGQKLARLFQRPIELIYNPTQGVVFDLLECILGRTFDFVSGPASYALERLSAALSDPENERVILLAHSQGGIIAANVVAGLIERFSGDARRLAKLEVYTLASASDHMPVDPELDSTERRVPYIEHFANLGDLIAQLGVLEDHLPIHGPVYARDTVGHFINAHYLRGVRERRYGRRDAEGNVRHDARLYEYLQGKRPTALPRPVLHPPPRPTSEQPTSVN